MTYIEEHSEIMASALELATAGRRAEEERGPATVDEITRMAMAGASAEAISERLAILGG